MKMELHVMQQTKTDWPTTVRLHQFIAKLFLFLFIILEWLHPFGKFLKFLVNFQSFWPKMVSWELFYESYESEIIDFTSFIIWKSLKLIQ